MTKAYTVICIELERRINRKEINDLQSILSKTKGISQIITPLGNDRFYVHVDLVSAFGMYDMVQLINEYFNRPTGELEGPKTAIDTLEEWHHQGIHDFDSNCSCAVCTIIRDEYLDEWHDSYEITDEMIAGPMREWAHKWRYELYEDVIHLRHYGWSKQEKEIVFQYSDDIFKRVEELGYVNEMA